LDGTALWHSHSPSGFNDLIPNIAPKLGFPLNEPRKIIQACIKKNFHIFSACFDFHGETLAEKGLAKFIVVPRGCKDLDIRMIIEIEIEIEKVSDTYEELTPHTNIQALI
jgi:hypothetical protein